MIRIQLAYIVKEHENTANALKI